jgi:hypothetical protein
MGPPSKAIPQYLKHRGDLLSKEDTVYSLSKMLLIQTKDIFQEFIIKNRSWTDEHNTFCWVKLNALPLLIFSIDINGSKPIVSFKSI